jgi:GTP-binding protein HflX
MDMQDKRDKAVLVGVHLGLRDRMRDTTEESMSELGDLAETAGLEVVGTFVQNRHAPEGATYIGEGKLDEVAEFIRQNAVDVAIFDEELTGIQTRNLNGSLGVPIIDRSCLILDIFASRAESNEGKLQVELAQLRYMLPRLAGSALDEGISRAGVGVGARGPGETKLETDRRRIRKRISALEEQLDEVAKNRVTMRRSRTKDGAQQVALLGYTNAGKSTLLNALTNANTTAKDMLFATLDPIARKLTMPDGAQVIFIDTVGFIRKLPHHLVRAFSSTLEESMLCDVILHVIDAFSAEREGHEQVVDALIGELNTERKPVLKVYNKADLLSGAEDDGGSGALNRDDAVAISAKTGAGIDELLARILQRLPDKRVKANLLIPYENSDMVAKIYAAAQVEKKEFTDEGTVFEVTIAQKDIHALGLKEFALDD